jgi:hypothetical protein
MIVNWDTNIRTSIHYALEGIYNSLGGRSHPRIPIHWVVDTGKKVAGSQTPLDLTPLDLGLLWFLLPKAVYGWDKGSAEGRLHHQTCYQAWSSIEGLLSHSQDYHEHLNNLADHDYQNKKDLGEDVSIYTEDAERRVHYFKRCGEESL